MRLKVGRSSFLWIAVLVCLLLSAAGDIGAGTKHQNPLGAPTSSGSGATPDTLAGGSPDDNDGDPDDFDLGVPLTIWIGYWVLVVGI